MPVIDVSKPEIIKFLVENYEKTAKLRIKWNIANKDKLKKAAQFTHEEKGFVEADVTKSIFEGGMPALVRDNITSNRTRRKKPAEPHVICMEDYRKDHSIVNLGLGDPKDDPRLDRPDDDFSFDPIMKPVPLKQMNMVYKGLPNYGRNEYLKLRRHVKPEDKYYFQESSGWQYGWRLSDSYFGKHVPSYPRRGLLHKSLVSRCGPKPDPEHYKSTIAILSPNRCVIPQ